MWATATMVDPKLEGWPWWREVLGKLFTGGSGGIVIGVLLIVLGLNVSAAGGRVSRETPKPDIGRPKT
jgi:hypothetical protein